MSAFGEGIEVVGPLGPHTLTVEPQGWGVPVPPGMTLLAAARAAGVVLPSACRNGTCRACLCPLVRGEAAHLIEWPGLSAEEKRDGFILPCVALARSDVAVHSPTARLATLVN